MACLRSSVEISYLPTIGIIVSMISRVMHAIISIKAYQFHFQQNLVIIRAYPRSSLLCRFISHYLINFHRNVWWTDSFWYYLLIWLSKAESYGVLSKIIKEESLKHKTVSSEEVEKSHSTWLHLSRKSHDPVI